MFRTKYDQNKKRYCSSSGSHLVPEFVLAYDEFGCGYLKEVGKINIYKKIQAHQDSCDMKLIESKLDPKMLANAMSSFKVEDVDSQLINDLTAAPATLGDALNSVKAAENLFAGLPLSVRKEFNFSASAFIKQSNSPKFKEIFAKSLNTPAAVPVAAPVAASAPVPVAAPVAAPAPVPAASKKKRKKIVEIEVDDDE